MQGPFNPDVPNDMGYQLPLVPKQIYNLGIADAEAWCQDKYHKTFAELSSEQQDEALGLWESGKAEFNSCRPRCSSPICCKTPAKGSSATRSMAAIKAWSAGR